LTVLQEETINIPCTYRHILPPTVAHLTTWTAYTLIKL